MNINKKESTEIKLFGVPIGVHNDVDTTLTMNNNLANDAVKRENAWTDDEHISFLEGLNKLGRGNWKEISTQFVPSRTPTQIASHAQKHFNKLTAKKMKRRRTSVFDIPYPRLNQDNNEVDENSFQASGAAGVSKNVTEFKEHPSTPANVARTTSERPRLSQVNGPEINQQSRVLNSTKARRFIPAVCWISTDDYSNESRHIHGFVVEPILDQANGSAFPTTNNIGKMLREMVLCETGCETVLQETNCDTNIKSVLPRSVVLRDSTNCDTDLKTVLPETVVLSESKDDVA